MREYALPLSVAFLLVLAGCSGSSGLGSNVASSGDAGSIGLAAGGAADATAFRHNVQEGYVPQPTDMTAEGLFHDYYFDTGQTQACEAMFCPSYSRAVTRDPLSNETERYLTVGFNSGLSKADFERKKLNLVVVVDISSSMSSSFDEYYYDGGEKQRVEDGTTKMQAARESVVALTEHLEADDRFGLVAYDDSAHVVQPLSRVGTTDMAFLRERVRGLQADGGTNLDAGMSTATGILSDYRNANQSEYETRVVYVTDAMPNLGDTSGDGLGSRLQANAEADVHSTFVGVGVDFNTKLVETINTVPGANYYTVHSPTQFRERMDEGFDYMVTPLVFDLSVTVESEGYEIETVYGSPSAENATGEVMAVQTLFPSRREDNRTEGGVVLVKLRETGESDQIRLTASYETRTGEERETTRTVEFGDHEPPFYDTTGVRKAVVLSRYADLMRNWAAYERARGSGDPEQPADGIEHRSDLGQWEQRSVPLTVSPPFDDRIARFERYFTREAEALGAERMQRDAAILATLRTNATDDSAAGSSTATGTAG
jgi:Ca-activated chloride channel family protein